MNILSLIGIGTGRRTTNFLPSPMLPRRQRINNNTFLMTDMKFKPSVLNLYALVFLAGCFGFTIYNYAQLSEGEGWGIVGMVGLFGFGIVLLVVDLVIQNLFKNKMTANIIGSVVSIIATLMLIFGGLFS